MKKVIPFLLVIIGCSLDNRSEIVRMEALNDVKSITTIFTSHQSDTKQKDGKIVAIATFNPDGSLSELIEQTTYPYDRDYELKKEVWEEPNKALLPYILDGLSLNAAENNLLYGNNWPAKYAKFLIRKAEDEKPEFAWKEIVEVDDERQPSEIKLSRILNDKESDLPFSGVIKAYTYEKGKVIEAADKFVYPEMLKARLEFLKKDNEEIDNEEIDEEEIKKELEESIKNPPKSNLVQFEYQEEKLTSVTLSKRKRHEFYYDGDLLIKSEFYVDGILFNTRIYYYEDGLKDRTEIFNMYNEPEYTITYEYEYWD